jgi:5,10-methylenetetrahydromethanopterin reductase
MGELQASLGIRLGPMDPPDVYLKDLRAAEEAGFKYIWIGDSQLIWRDVYAYMALAARETRRAGLGVFVTNPVTRHVSVTANAVSTIDEISGGRTILGVGTGDTALRLMGLRPSTLVELEDALTKLRALLQGEQVKLSPGDRAIRLEHARPVPIYLSATGPKTCRLAGRTVDGVILKVGLHPSCLDAGIEEIQAGMQEAGRAPADVAVGAMVHVVISPDRERARAWARPLVHWFREMTPALFERAGLSVPPLADDARIYPDFQHAQDMDRAARSTAYLTDEMIDAFVICGTVEDCKERIQQFLASFTTLSHLIVQPVMTFPGKFYPEQTNAYFVRAFSDHILPVISSK